MSYREQITEVPLEARAFGILDVRHFHEGQKVRHRNGTAVLVISQYTRGAATAKCRWKDDWRGTTMDYATADLVPVETLQAFTPTTGQA